MSRRKQARPKSCKLEGMVEKREETEGEGPSPLHDLSAPSTSAAVWAEDSQPSEAARPSTPAQHRTGDGQEPRGCAGDEGGTGATAGAGRGESPVLRCEACSAVFDSLDQFMDHRNFVCTTSSSSGSLETGLIWSTQDKPEWSGSDSGSGSPQPVNLEDGVSSPLPLHLSEEQLPFAIGISITNPYGCQYCEKAFTETRYLHVHERVHSDQLPFKCDRCQRVFKHKRNRDRHAKLHVSERTLRCPQCEATFSRKEDLRAHIRGHESSKLYQCPVCQSGYSSAVALTSHLVTHQSVEGSATTDLLACLHCGQSFETIQLLQEHMSIHTAAIKVEKVSCDVCSQQFSTQDALETHMEHAHYSRQIAPEAHTRYSRPTRHPHHRHHSSHNSRTHPHHHPMEVDPSALMLKCPMCPLSYADTLSLCQHLMTHTAAATMTLTTDLDPASLVRGGKDMLEVSPGKDGSRSHTPKRPISSSAVATDLSLSPGAGGSGASSRLSSKTPQSLVCPYCLSDSFDSLESLELHMQSVHSVKSNEIYTCNYCNAPYPNLYSLHDHMNVVHRNHPGIGIKYPCSLCNNQFPSIEALAKHKSLSHSYPDGNNSSSSSGNSTSTTGSSGGGGHSGGAGGGGIDSAFCGQCSLTFPTVRQLEDHMVSVHGATVDKKAGGKTRGRKPNGSKGNKENKHGPSSKSSKSPRHTSSSSSSATASSISMVVTDATSLVPTSPARTPAPAPLPTESITCDECNATFHELANFQAHMKLHIDAALAKFTCKKCGQQMGSQEQLEAHLSLHYLCLATEYGCTSCMKLFSKPDELQKHLMDIHAHHLYRCALCKEIFDSKVNIQVHFAIKHSNECKLFKCTQCSNIFRSEMEWQVHVRVNHLHLAKPYRCLFCAESFTSEMELQCHLTTHSKPFRCTMCDQAFHIEYLLDQHMQTEHADADTKAAVAALFSSSSSNTTNTSTTTTASSLNSISIKEEADSSTSVLTNLIQSRSSRPPSQGSDTQKSVSPAALTAPQPSASPLATVSAVWKNSEAVHVCNICDSRFTQLALLAIHKAQEHGVRSAVGMGGNSLSPSSSGKGRSASASPMGGVMVGAGVMAGGGGGGGGGGFATPMAAHSSPAQSSREKFLQQNQTLVSVLTAETQQSSSQMACTLCSQTFRNQTECDKHMKIHANSTSLKCNICDETFPSGSTLAEHKLQHCKIQQGNICFVCKLPLKTEEQFYSHAQEHGYQGSLLQCIVCRQTLASVVELQMHGKHHYQLQPSFHTCCVCLQTFHSKENLVAKLNSTGRTYYVCKPCYHGESPLHTCLHCSEKFASKAQLDAHTATHNTPRSVSPPAKSAVNFSSDSTPPQTFQCIKCQESFSSEYEIQLHVANHMLQEGTAHECKLCTMVFESPAKLQCHLIEHAYKNRAEIRCTICGKVFGSAAEIQIHALEHGVAGRRHTCGQCNQRFFFSSELDNHVLIYNHSPGSQSAESPHKFECQECTKVFTSATALSNHHKTHERREPASLRCSLCSQTFPSVALMQQHFLACHMGGVVEVGAEEGGGKDSLPCPQCKQQFPTSESLQLHVHAMHNKAGSDLVCPVCNKSFTQTKLLTLHLRSHADRDAKPFSCSVCQKKFSREENLKAHMKSHTNVPGPLVCPLCNQSFSQRSDITHHLKTHLSSTEEQDGPTAPQSTQDSSSIGALENSTPAVANGDLSNTSSSESLPGINGMHDEENETSAADVVSPGPHLTRSSACKT